MGILPGLIEVNIIITSGKLSISGYFGINVWRGFQDIFQAVYPGTLSIAKINARNENYEKYRKPFHERVTIEI